MKTYYISKKPPSVNELFGTNFKTKRRFTSKKYEEWQADAMQEVLEKGKSGIEGDFAMRIYIPFKFRRANADLLNLEKAITDLLVKAGLIPDDRHLVNFAMRWADCDKVEVSVFQSTDTIMAG